MKNVFMVVMMLVLLSVVHAGIAPSVLPASSYYQGRHSRSFDLGSEGVLDLRLEFAVYKGGEAATMMDMTGYTGDLVGSENAFVYAYQVFNDVSSTAELAVFSLTGINPNGIASVGTDISQAESMTAPDSTEFDSKGVAPSLDGYFDDSKTKGVWEFEGGTMIEGEQSWFLFLYSGSDWIKGDIEVQPLADDDVPIPGDSDSTTQDVSVPEPVTLALLACGAVLSLRRKK